MFGLFSSPDKQMRDNASNWLDVADRVYHYRRDQMSEITLTDLQRKTEKLRALVREKADAARLKLAIEELEPMLAQAGGRIYPHSALREWVEFFVVAAILLIGSRQFFFQPFKIPTNSMWPTYNGMVPEVHATPADEPGTGASLFRKIAYGATTYRVDAPNEGEILIPVIYNQRKNIYVPSGTPSSGRQWLIFPEKQIRYTVLVGTTPVSVSVPADFDMGWTFKDTFAPDKRSFDAMCKDWAANQKLAQGTLTLENGQSMRTYFVKTGRYLRTGDRVFSFDIITGDQLFVDRLSYHFVRPSVGSGFVFRTRNIRDIGADSYYIKRLAGTPGDQLEIRPPMLYRNGTQITGAQAFIDNNTRAGKYRGYANGQIDEDYPEPLLLPNQKYTVSKNGYIALGDNSYNSLDSRYWGEVPKKDAIGRPLWVFYPFGKHWGPAK